MKTKFPIWLVSYLLRTRRATQKQILADWLNVADEATPMHRNTFNYNKKKAEELFDINITCDEHTNEYYIEGDEMPTLTSVNKWLLQSFSAFSVISRSRKLKTRIQLEPTSGGEEFMDVITEAMDQGCCVLLTYQRYWDDTSKVYEVEPYFIKQFKHRWYLIAKKRTTGEFRTYCFDRFCSVRLSDATFVYKKDEESESLFLDYFGIIQGDEKKERIVLKVICEQGKYLETRPLHYSQTLIQKDEDFMVFELYLRPCFDFVQELLTHGSDLEVLEPASLRQQMIDSVQAMCKRYHINEI